MASSGNTIKSTGCSWQIRSTKSFMRRRFVSISPRVGIICTKATVISRVIRGLQYGLDCQCQCQVSSVGVLERRSARCRVWDVRRRSVKCQNVRCGSIQRHVWTPDTLTSDTSPAPIPCFEQEWLRPQPRSGLPSRSAASRSSRGCRTRCLRPRATSAAPQPHGVDCGC